jgi:hypothetical protein
MSTSRLRDAVPTIDPHMVFTVQTLMRTLGLKEGSIPREIRQGRLKAHRRCGRYFILGSDVITWLTSNQPTPQRSGMTAGNGMRT